MTALATTVGIGAVTAFTIAFTLLQIPIGVIGVPLGVVLFPSLSREAADGDHAEFVALLTRALRLLAFVMLPVAVLAADPARRDRRRCCSADSTRRSIRLTADTLLAFLPGLAAHALIAVLARAFYARQDTRTPVLAAIVAVVINTTLAAVLVGPYGLPGMAFAIAIAAWLEAAALLVLLRRREGRLGLATVAWLAVRTLLAAVVAGAAAIFVHGIVGPALAPDPASLGRAGIPGIAAVIVVVSTVMGATFVVAALALRIEELRSIVEIMVDALRRPSPAVTAPIDAGAWDAFVEASDPGSYLQLSPWARVKAVNGWSAHRLLATDRVGAQVLVRRPRPLPWGFAYAPRGPVGGDWSARRDRGILDGRA